AAQPDGQQRLPGGGVLTARPRARVLFQPLLGSQVRAGRFLHLSAAGAGRTGRERGHHLVRLGASRSRLGGGGSQGQGGPWAQGGPGRDSWWCHSGPWSLLPMALPPALPAPEVAAAPKGLVHSPGAQCHGRCCCLSSGGGAPSSSQRGPPSNAPRAGTQTPTPQPKMESPRQKRKAKKNYQHVETIPLWVCESDCVSRTWHYLGLVCHP
ncbi:hypothetical protein MC885_020859, partial [Smutsia gigantea]